MAATASRVRAMASERRQVAAARGEEIDRHRHHEPDQRIEAARQE